VYRGAYVYSPDGDGPDFLPQDVPPPKDTPGRRADAPAAK
jgi:hypothetical protein